MVLPVLRVADDHVPTDWRAALRAAIAKRDAAVRDLAAQREANARAQGMVAAGEEKVEAARAQMEAAREDHAQRVVEAASTGKPLKAGNAIRAAREAELTALDELDAARAAAARFAAALDFENTFLGKPTDPISVAEEMVAQAVDDVIRRNINIDQSVRRATSLLDELVKVRSDLVALVREGLIEVQIGDAIAEVLRPVNLPTITVNRNVINDIQVDYYNFFGSPSLTAMRDALRRDSDATILE